MAKFIMAGPLQAIGFVLLFSVLSIFLPLMNLLSNAAIGLITLRLGWRRGLVVAAGSSAALATLGLFMHADPVLSFGLSFTVWLVIVGFATLLSNTVSWARTLTTVLALGMGAVALFHLKVADPVAFWQNQPAWAQFVEMAKALQVIPTTIPEAEQQQVWDSTANILVGSIAGTFSTLLVLSLLIARHWQATLYNPGGLSAEWRELQLGKPAAVLMIAAIGLALFGQSVAAINMVFAGISIFLFQGIALVHGVVALLQLHKGWLVGTYVLLFLMPVHVGVLLAAFGVIESLAGFRSQLKARKH